MSLIEIIWVDSMAQLDYAIS